MSAFIDDFPISTISMSSANVPVVVTSPSFSSSVYQSELAAIDHINRLLLKAIETRNHGIQTTFIEYIEILHHYYYENENYYLADYIHNNILHKINNNTLETLRGRSGGAIGRDNASLLQDARSRLRDSMARVSNSISSASTAIATVSISENQISNHRWRFGLDKNWPYANPPNGEETDEGAGEGAAQTLPPPHDPRKSWRSHKAADPGALTTFNIGRISRAFSSIGANAFAYNSGGAASDGRAVTDYDDVCDEEVLRAPIVDMCICQRSDPIPPDFYKITKTSSNSRANLNSGSGGNHIYLCIRKEARSQAQRASELPITALVVVMPDRGECVPPGFLLVRRGKHICNVNTGTTSERIFLCFKRDRGNPIVDVQIFFPSRNECCPQHFCAIERTATDLVADLNAGTGGHQIFLAYRQVISRLECLWSGAAELYAGRCGRTASGNLNLAAARQRRGDAVDEDKRLAETSDRVRIAERAVVRRLSSSLDDSFSIGTGEPDEQLRYERELTGNESYYIPSAVSSSGDLPQEADATTDLLSDRSVSELESDRNDFDAMSESTGEQPSAGRGGKGVSPDDVSDSSGATLSYDAKVVLYLLLLCLYTRDTQISDISVAVLSRLVSETTLFSGAFNAPHSALLDVMVDCLLDRLDFCYEPDHRQVVPLLSMLVRCSRGGALSPHAMHKLFKYASFHFNYYSSKRHWEGSGGPCNTDGSEIDMVALLRELVLALLAQAEKTVAASQTGDGTSECSDEPALCSGLGAGVEALAMMRSLVEEVAEQAIENYEVSLSVDFIDALLVKRDCTVNSMSSFWTHVMGHSARLFPAACESGDGHTYALRQLSTALCGLCKLCSQQIRHDNMGQPSPRDVGCRLLGLDALIELLSSAGEGVRGSRTVGYLVRRLVLPLVLRSLGGSGGSLVDSRIFAKLLRVLSVVWRYWREHTRLEFASVTEHLLIKILSASSVNISPVFQLATLHEVETWFDQPQLLVEMFVNYDMDQRFMYHWDLFQRLVRSICALARRTGRHHRGGEGIAAGSRRLRGAAATAADVSAQALREAARIAKALMDASGHAFLLMCDEDLRRRSLAEGWGDDAKAVGCSAIAGVQADAVLSRSDDALRSALKMVAEQQPIKLAVALLVSSGVLLAGAREVAAFLHMYRGALDPASLGEYLGQPGNSSTEELFYAQLRHCYARATSFADMDVETALRLFLTAGGFRTPGESQVIGRFVEVFAACYYADNAGAACCPFSRADTVYLVSYGIIMLNTDLHKAANTKVKKMTKEAWVNQFRGTDGGADIDRYYLLRIYENISSDAIKLDFPSREGARHSAGAPDSGDASAAPYPAAEGAIRTSQRRSRGVEINAIDKSLDEAAFAQRLTGCFREAAEGLRLFAPLRPAFCVSGVDANISLDIVADMFDSVWVYLLAIVTDLLVRPFQHMRTPTNEDGSAGEGDASTKRDSLNTRVLDIYTTFHALDILCYAITAALFLGLRAPKEAFVAVLQTFRALASADGPDQPEQFGSWRQRVLGCDCSAEGEVVETVNMLHKLFSKLKDRIQETVLYELTRAVAAKIDKRARVLYTNSFFVRQGELVKLNRNGRPDPYRFFLFSDFLYYCHRSSLSGRYVLHGELRLSSIIVTDIDSDARDCSFHLTNPLKSFVVVARSPDEKADWLRDISITIESCIKRMTIDST